MRPNRVEFNQFLFRIERIPDTVQTDHVDWGFHFDNLYGYDYHFTTMKGVFSNQLLNNPNPNPEPANATGKIYGDDPMILYGDLYIPCVAEGMVMTHRPLAVAARHRSAVLAQQLPGDALDPLHGRSVYADVGVLTTTQLTDQWTVQLGVHGGDDTASGTELAA